MYLAIITLPLLGSIVSGFFGRKVGVSGAQVIACIAVVLTTLFAVVAFFEVGHNNTPINMEVFRWIDSESLNVWWAFNFDSLTVSMLIPVLIVSSLVHIYSIGYMSNDPHNQRFFSYLSLFTFMMVILVTANNYLLMFVGWEGVGVCSYLLVCFWFTRIAANQSALSAFLTNRVGDCFLTIGMFGIIWSFGNLDYATVFSLAPYMNEKIVTLVGICILIGAMAKSSQVGLHVWLPMAMEGPTPVSALIHAATMVTAGVYILMRSSPLIEYSSTVLMLCLWLGAITTVFSSLIGLFQQDIKKVIAYSTMSQLGMMVIAVGLSSYNIALFHLVNHAFYKALLFLGAGSVIHAVADNQDFRRYGGLRSFLPLTYSVMLIASLSLVAFPFMTGFYSKDLILESAYGQYHFSSTVVYIIATIGAMFTTLYSVKVLYLTFLTNPNGPLINYKQAHEGDIFMSLPLMVLAVFSIFFGFITKDVFIGLGSGFFSDNALFIHPSHEILLDTEFGVPTFFKLLPLIFTISLSVVSIILSEYLSLILIYFKLSRVGYNIFSFFNQRFLIELFYNKFITGLLLKLGGQTTKVLDKGSIEYLGPYGLEKLLLNMSSNIGKLNSGVITSYALYILVGVIFYVLFYSYFDKIVVILVLGISLSLISWNRYSKEPLSINTSVSSIHNGLESSVFFLTIMKWAISLFSDFLKIFKEKTAPLLEWELENAPKPHAFSNSSLESSGNPWSKGGVNGQGSNEGRRILEETSQRTQNEQKLESFSSKETSRELSQEFESYVNRNDYNVTRPKSQDTNNVDTNNANTNNVDTNNANTNTANDADSVTSSLGEDQERVELHREQLDKYNDPGLRQIAEKADRGERLDTPERDAWEAADEDNDGGNGHLGDPSVTNLENAKEFSKKLVDNNGRVIDSDSEMMEDSDSDDIVESSLLPLLGLGIPEIPVLRCLFIFLSCISNPYLRFYFKYLYLQIVKK
jgi:NADH-ubiquinone oxidoreductase chain 5